MTQTVQSHGVYIAAYGTVHYKKPLKSFERKVGHCPGFDFLLSRYCHDCAESHVKQYSYIPLILNILIYSAEFDHSVGENV